MTSMLFAFCSFSATASESALKVNLKNGESVTFELREKPSVQNYYDKDKDAYFLDVSGIDAKATFDADEVRNAEFIESTSFIKLVAAQVENTFVLRYVGDNNVVVFGAKDVQIYNHKGKIISSGKAINGEDKIVLSLANQSAGAYRVKVNGSRTFRIVKQ